MGEKDPYGKTTYENTHAPWINEATPVDVDLDGLREYAKLIAGQRKELAQEAAHLTHLHDTPARAWAGSVLGEAAAIRQQLMNNAGELSSYLGQLGQAMFNIGSAAQTIADIYQDGDATSAASMNDVLFAFGDKFVARPAGLPEGIGRTYLDAVTAARTSAVDTGPAPDSPEWGDPTVTTISPYQQMTTSIGPAGQRREQVITSVPGSGVVIEAVTVYNAQGTVVFAEGSRTTTSYDSGKDAVVTSVENNSDGGTVTTTTTDDGETTVGVDVKGRETSTTQVTTGPDGSTTETTTEPDGPKRDVTDRVVTGPATDGTGRTAPTASVASGYDPIAQRETGRSDG